MDRKESFINPRLSWVYSNVVVDGLINGYCEPQRIVSKSYLLQAWSATQHVPSIANKPSLYVLFSYMVQRRHRQSIDIRLENTIFKIFTF